MNKKNIKPEFTVDITRCANEQDVAAIITLAKVKKYLTEENQKALANVISDISTALAADMALISLFQLMTEDYNTLHFDGKNILKMNLTCYDIQDDEKFECYPDGSAAVVATKKPNVFKRFWNWITRKK